MKVTGDQVVATRSVSAMIENNPAFAKFVEKSFLKFMEHDWGQTAEDSVESNNLAVQEGGADQIFAVYKQNDFTLWIITEYDGSVTTLLFPEDY